MNTHLSMRLTWIENAGLQALVTTSDTTAVPRVIYVISLPRRMSPEVFGLDWFGLWREL